MLVQSLFAGMFLFNAFPHLFMGITGKTHMTPFKRVSSPIINIIWAFANIILVVVILGFDPTTGMLRVPAGTNFWVFLFGGFFMSMADAWLFGKPGARFPWHKD